MHPPLYSINCKRIKQNCSPVSTWTFTSTEPVELLVLAAPQSSVCSTSQSDQSRSWETCNIICCRFYKFVLVFEPYMCQHFVSDLIWAVLSTDMVPVVFGKDEMFWKSENLLLFSRGSELLQASAKRLIYWCTQPVSEKSCPFSQVLVWKVIIQLLWFRYLDRSDELYSSYLLWKDSYRVETQVTKMQFSNPLVCF